MKKKWIVISLLLLLGLVLTGCTTGGSDTDTTAATAEPTAAATASPTAAATAEPATEPKEVTMTLNELAQYNGQNGNPAYIAVDGVIYDVTDVPQWSGGGHNGFTAGNDLTEEIKTISPHGVSKLNGLPVVGTLVD